MSFSVSFFSKIISYWLAVPAHHFIVIPKRDTNVSKSECNSSFIDGQKVHCKSGWLIIGNHNYTYMYIKHSSFDSSLVSALFYLREYFFNTILVLWFAACAMNDSSCSCMSKWIEAVLDLIAVFSLGIANLLTHNDPL